MTIIWWLLGLVGVSGAGIGIAVLLGGGPVILRIALKVLGFAKSLSPKTWLYIGGAVAVVIGVIWHQSYAHGQLKSADKGGYDRRATEDVAALKVLKKRVETAEANFNRVTQEVRNRHDQEVSANAAAAAALKLRGPGAASCRLVRDPAVRASSGRPVESAAAVDAAVDRLPDQGGAELIALPFAGTLIFSQSHDDLLAEVKAWRAWYPKVAAEQNALRQPLAKPAK